MKSIVLCFFMLASLAVNLVELYEYDSNSDYQRPNAIASAPSELNNRPNFNEVEKIITRRNAPDYFKSDEVKTSVSQDVQLETQRNKRHIPGFHSSILSGHYYPHAAPIATYPVAAAVPVVEEAPYVPAYHYSPYGYGAAYGAHAVL